MATERVDERQRKNDEEIWVAIEGSGDRASNGFLGDSGKNVQVVQVPIWDILQIYTHYTSPGNPDI